MLFYTHVLFSILVGIIYNEHVSIYNKILFYSILILSSILIDIDSAKSFIGKRLALFSKFFNFIFGHREFFHSFLFIIPSFLLISVFSSEASIAFILGSCSHLLLDALTKEGIMPYYPWKHKVKGFFKTGSWLERIFAVLIIIVIFWLVFNL